MLDKPADVGAQARATGRPPLDFQQHLADLEARGLLVRIDRPINKDTELHPLVRWQFLGGVAEDKRRAFLFTHVTDGKGRRYDMPVAVGALAASPEIYALGMGRRVEEIGEAWMQAIHQPIAPVMVATPPLPGRWSSPAMRCARRRRAGAAAGADLDARFGAAPYLTARCASARIRSGVQNGGFARLKATGVVVRMVAREAPAPLPAG